MRNRLKYLGIFLPLLLIATPLNAASPKPGGPCTNVGSTLTSGGKNYVCAKSGNKLTWVKSVAKPPAKKSPGGSPASQDCGVDTGYTCNKLDVIDMQRFKCEAREQENYRTDRTLVIDPTDSRIMYVSVEYRGIYKTTDGGKNWIQKTKGIKVYAREDDKTKGCYSEYPVMRMDPKNPKRIVLGVSSGGGGNLHPTNSNQQVGGVYQSFDGAETWKLMINNKMNTYVTDVAIDPIDPNIVYYSTSSNPGSWQEADQNKLFVTKGLIYKTTDSGKNWTELPTGIGKNSSVTSILINPSNPNQIAAPTFSAIRLSADGTGTGKSDGKNTDVKQLGILSSEDGGKTWKSTQTPDVNPINGSFSSPNNWLNQYYVPMGANSNYGLASMDGGKTFIISKPILTLAYDPFDFSGNTAIGYSTVNIGPADQNLNLWESKDAGKTWEKYGKLPVEIKDANGTKTRVSNILWDTKDKNTLYMSGTSGNVWKSSDRGMTWVNLLNIDRIPLPK